MSTTAITVEPEKAKQWANKALDIFDREEIEEDGREMRSLLNSWQSKDQ